jgi:protein-disulfide isomerase
MFFQNTDTNKEGGNVWVAISIIVAGLLIAGAVIFTNQNGTDSGIVGQDGQEGSDDAQEIQKIPEVSEDDYIKGNPDAPIKIVEYSDPECVFCLRLHPTLNQIISEYPDQVAWVYRHIDTRLHRKLMAEATAAECAGELGGNDAFWSYLDRIYSTTKGNDNLDLGLLPEFAADLGLNEEEFKECFDSGRYIEKVNTQTQNAFAAGATGSPFSVIITPEGSHLSVSGAQPIDVWRQALDAIILNELTADSATSSPDLN